MDVNIDIIEGVKQFPCLHDNNSNLEERNEAWKELAAKMQLSDVFLKLRWHTLLQEYHRDVKSKYSKYMHFICRNSEKIAEVNWPEFIINEEDLKDKSAEEQEDFVISEDAELKKKQCLKQERKPEKRKRTCHKQKEDVPDKENKNNKPDKFVVKSETADDDTSTNEHTKQSDDVGIDTQAKPKETDNTTSQLEDEPAESNTNKDDQLTATTNVHAQPFITERCEDVIFGELVSAMLKRMDESKKKNIKRDIMNLLFS